MNRLIRHEPTTHEKYPLTIYPDLGDLKFNSTFEGGNLDLVVRVGDAEYDLFMRVDSNTSGHTNWYNFTISDFKIPKS